MLAKIKKISIWIMASLFAVLFLFFAMVNSEVVTLQLTPLPYVLEMRLFVFVGLFLLIGSFMGWIVASFECRRRYLVKKETKRRITALEDEVAALRARHHLPEAAPSYSAAQEEP